MTTIERSNLAAVALLRNAEGLMRESATMNPSVTAQPQWQLAWIGLADLMEEAANSILANGPMDGRMVTAALNAAQAYVKARRGSPALGGGAASVDES